MVDAVIDAILNPRAVAVVGASDDPAKWGGSVLSLLLKFGFGGRIHPVNPRGGTIQGLPASPSIGAIGQPVDVAVLAVPQERTLAVLEDCAEAGVKACLLLTSQFAESGPEGERLQQQLVAAARRTGMRLIGPNCMGYFNSHANLSLLNAQALLRNPVLVKGELALISQSGALAGAMLARAYDIGSGFSICVSLGNQADLEICDFFEYAIGDPHSRVILLYVEGLKSPHRFVALLAAARAAGKPVLILKAGRTEVGTEAVRSHTASLAGAWQAFEASVQAAGAIIVDDFIDLVTFGTAWARLPDPAGAAVAPMSGSGGGAALTADLVAESGLPVARLDEQTVERLAARMPRAAAHLPFDMGAVPATLRGARDWLPTVLATVMADPSVGSGLFVLTTQPDMTGSARAVAGYSRRRDKPLLFVNAASHCGADALAALIADGGMPFESIRQALRYQRLRFEATQALAQAAEAPDGVVDPGAAGSALPAAITAAVLETAARLPAGPLSEAQAKQLLAAAGVMVPADAVAADAEAAVAAAGRIGYPVAMKIISPQISHKSDLGGVALGLADAAAVRAAFATLRAAVGRVEGAGFEGCLVQAMVPADIEFIAGTRFDPQFGTMLLFGFGGTLVELDPDTRMLPAHASPVAIERAIRGLKRFALLDGYRGRTPVDLARLAATISRIGQLAIVLGERLPEFEANPLMLCGDSVVAADARAVWRG